ncbi:hypothetical protein Axy13_022 [Achromobacter phage vB_AxyP_19-32_Axy13]|uniref:Uncharacterized protein n=1 Tax=Achromobacter phage vB_AxyP_19-32_Axy13 TaxID=2591044 RepID=A0A514CUQ9_9CAUD|nr:hypothetical protein Axy13_022 [Achromobacter phage vB_AxyP_19-32_Axy13]
MLPDDAIKVVLELARQNLAPDDMPEEQRRQLAAIESVERNLVSFDAHVAFQARLVGTYEVTRAVLRNAYDTVQEFRKTGNTGAVIYSDYGYLYTAVVQMGASHPLRAADVHR